MAKKETTKHEKNYTLAIVSIIAIVIIVFIVSAYLQYSASTNTLKDSAGQAYAGVQANNVPNPNPHSGKVIIVGTATDVPAYLRHNITTNNS